MEKIPDRRAPSACSPRADVNVTRDVALTDAINAVFALNARLHMLYDRIVGADKTNYDTVLGASPHSLYALLNDGPTWITDSCSASLDAILEIERALYGEAPTLSTYKL